MRTCLKFCGLSFDIDDFLPMREGDDNLVYSLRVLDSFSRIVPIDGMDNDVLRCFGGIPNSYVLRPHIQENCMIVLNPAMSTAYL
jgi:hypothetical protein